VTSGSARGPAAVGITASGPRRGYILTAGVLLVMMAGGTLPIPLYRLYERQMGFGPLGVTIVFAAYVAGTLAALLTVGDLSDHVGRRKVLAIGVACAAVSATLFVAAHVVSMVAPSSTASRGQGRNVASGEPDAHLTESPAMTTLSRCRHAGPGAAGVPQSWPGLVVRRGAAGRQLVEFQVDQPRRGQGRLGPGQCGSVGDAQQVAQHAAGRIQMGVTGRAAHLR